MAGPVQRCTVCSAENDIIRLTCLECGAVLRDRVAALNLFETGFNVLIEPRDTFLRIARSEQRNYVLLLFTMTGVLLYSVFLAAIGAGDLGIHVGLLILSYFIGAPLFGIPVGLLTGYLSYQIAPIELNTNRWRIHREMYAWALVPIAFVAPIVAILAFAIFGNYLFSLDYTAAAYKPGIFYLLLALMGVAVVLSMMLIRSAFSALGMAAGKATVQAAAFWAILAGLLAVAVAISNYFIHQAQANL